MTRGFRTAALSCLLGLCSTGLTPLWGQGHCRPADSMSAKLVLHIGRYTSAQYPGDEPVRDSLRLRATPAARVRLVRNPMLCAAAARAYRRELTTAASTHTDSVFVLRADDRYVVLDPAYQVAPPGDSRYGKNWIIAIFDPQWRLLSTF